MILKIRGFKATMFLGGTDTPLQKLTKTNKPQPTDDQRTRFY